MKIALAISLILNLVLGVWLLRQDSRPPLERIIVEKHIEEKLPLVKELRAQQPLKKNQPKKSADSQVEDIGFNPENFTPDEFGELALVPENARKDYLINELNIPEEKLQKHEELRMEYFTASSKFNTLDPTGELTLDDRRKMLDLEEAYTKKVIKLYGKANWDKFNQYRRKYNADVINRSRKEGSPPFIMMP